MANKKSSSSQTKKRSTSVNKSNSGSSSSKSKLQNLKSEVASSLNIDLKSGKNGSLTARQAGSIGGEMVKRMVEYAEKNLK